MSAVLWAMYADTADYAEWKTNRRATGLVFSASLFAQKFGWGWAGGITALLMSYLGFVPDQAQTPGSLHGMVELMTIFPAGMGVLSLFLIALLYPLNEKRMSQIAADLRTRRAADAASPAVA